MRRPLGMTDVSMVKRWEASALRIPLSIIKGNIFINTRKKAFRTELLNELYLP